MRHFLTTGIILQKRNSGENNHYLTIFSPEHGRINAVSKYSRNLKSALGGNLEMLNFCQFQIYETPHNFTVIQCQLEKSYLNIRDNLEKSLYAMHLLEIFEKSVNGQNTDESFELFQLLETSIEFLASTKNYELIIENFKIQLLNILGNFPDISLCFFCQKKWTENDKIWLDQEGSLACLSCFNRIHGITEVIPFSLMKLIHFLVRPTQKLRLDQIILSQEQQFQLKRVINIFIQNYLHREIVSERMLQKIIEN